MGFRYLRRYTNLPSTLHVLQNRELTLLNPNTWDDRNDAHYIAEFKRRVGAKSVLALCFAATKETYHHWRVFSGGSDGVCLEFDLDTLSRYFDRDSQLTYKLVMYKEIKDAPRTRLRNLPFLKRSPFSDEREFRLIYVDMNQELNFATCKIPLSSIRRVTLSPWMPQPLVDAVKNSILSAKGCHGLEVYRSTLIENERWKRAALTARK